MTAEKKKGALYRKLHRWPGLILSFILIWFGITGIIMNHRSFFSGTDLPRTSLPGIYSYEKWGNGALKGNLSIEADSILIYGNIGVWVTDSTFTTCRSLNRGFPAGADNRKVLDLHRDDDGRLYAATLFGLYAFDDAEAEWKKFDLDVDIERFVAVEHVGDTLYALNRSYLFRGLAAGPGTRLEKIELKAPERHDRDVTLFETIWQLHSGEILGLPGQLFVDLLGLVTIFLSLTGIVYFFFPGWIRRRRKKQKPAGAPARINRWSLKWHNRAGEWLFFFLAFLFFTGTFLRPPLLITIAGSRVAPIRFSHLDQPNPWHDRLRDLRFDRERDLFLISTSAGMFTLRRDSLKPEICEIQPPVSVMGITVLEPLDGGAWLTGSFSGLFLWHPEDPRIIDFVRGKVFEGARSGRPVGDFTVTGLITDSGGNRYMVDYSRGVIPLRHDASFPDPPENLVRQTRMSLWNLSLEIHTARIYQLLIGDFYILIIPMTGLAGVMVVLSGYLMWRKRKRRSSQIPG